MAPGPSLKQKIQQKLLKPKYTPHTDDEALHLCNPARANSSDIVLDAVSSRGSSRPASTDPNSADAHAYHDITASLLDPTDAAAAGRSDQGTHSSTAVKPSRVSGPFKGCLPFGKPPVPKSTPAKKAAPPNDGLPTAFNNRGSILSRLSKAARKSPVPTSPPQPKPKPAPKAAPVKTKKVAHPLHMAAWRTNINELQEQLAKPGADANKRDKNSMTPLHYAAWQGSIDCVQLLLEHKADINKADAEGMLPIHFAAMFNRLDVVAMLLDRGSHLQPPPAKKGRLQVTWPTTPLIVAAKMGHPDMVALLMQRGATIAGLSKASKSALHEAAMCGHADVVAEMLRRGADHDLALTKTGYRALHLAALKGSQPVVQVLLLRGALVDARAKDGRTALHVACEHGRMEAAAALIGLGGADLSARDNAGLTALHVAVDKNHLALAKTLMDRGATVDTATNMGALPLNFAHDPDFYKLLRAVRWYSASSCPSGNNPSSSSYWSPPGAMEAAAAASAAVDIDVDAALEELSAEAPAAAPVEPCTGLPNNYFGPGAAVPDAQYFGGFAPPAAPAAGSSMGVPMPGPPAAASSSGKGVGVSGKPSKSFQASSWLKSLHLGKKDSKKAQAAGLTATTALAQGDFAPLSAAAAAAAGANAGPLPTSSTAAAAAAAAAAEYDYLPYTTAGPGSAAGKTFEAVPVAAAAAAAGVGVMVAAAAAGTAGSSRSNSRASSISLAGKRSVHHSPSGSEGSSVVARTAAAEIARAAVANVVERATREEQQGEIQVAPVNDETHGYAPGASLNALQQQQQQQDRPYRSSASSPDTWSLRSSASGRPASAVTASAASGNTTQAALRRLLGFDKDPVEFGKAAPGDVGARRSIGDQDKWLPGSAATPTSAATFAAFAADAAQQDDVNAAAALAASSGVAAGTKPSAAAAAAAFTAAAAAAAAAAVGRGTGSPQGGVDAVKQGGSPGAGKGSAGKGSIKSKVLRPWRA